jgi:hypothetical protein
VRGWSHDQTGEVPAGAARAGRLWVADLSYVATWAGFVYVAVDDGPKLDT